MSGVQSRVLMLAVVKKRGRNGGRGVVTAGANLPLVDVVVDHLASFVLRYFYYSLLSFVYPTSMFWNCMETLMGKQQMSKYHNTDLCHLSTINAFRLLKQLQNCRQKKMMCYLIFQYKRLICRGLIHLRSKPVFFSLKIVK